jgi:cytidylate kinase
MIITLDGPTASGKSSIARALAQRLGGVHFNSGFVYRCIGYIAARDHSYTHETIQAIPNALVHDLVQRMTYEYRDTARIVFDGIDITQELKCAHVDALASCVSGLFHVRDVVNAYAQDLLPGSLLWPNIIADGRDCGTVMFPQAEYKFFITASPAVRAQRWVHDQQKQGKHYSFEQALALVNERDARDMSRSVAPLMQAQDAMVIDTSVLMFDDVLEKIQILL